MISRAKRRWRAKGYESGFFDSQCSFNPQFLDPNFLEAFAIALPLQAQTWATVESILEPKHVQSLELYQFLLSPFLKISQFNYHFLWNCVLTLLLECGHNSTTLWTLGPLPPGMLCSKPFNVEKLNVLIKVIGRRRLSSCELPQLSRLNHLFKNLWFEYLWGSEGFTNSDECHKIRWKFVVSDPFGERLYNTSTSFLVNVEFQWHVLTTAHVKWQFQVY